MKVTRRCDGSERRTYSRARVEQCTTCGQHVHTEREPGTPGLLRLKAHTRRVTLR